ncbi:hypothetical protein [Saccharospirillum sp.]|uniref:hypothetical protein n=1 Tax=Saccharospirillum sp. TaxID=2033801 RepID=UPI0034A051F5
MKHTKKNAIARQPGISTGHPAQLVIGLTVWCVWFVVVYGSQAVACKLAAPDPIVGAFNPINLMLGLITLLIALGLAWGAKTCWRSTGSSASATALNTRQAWFIARIAAGLYAVSAIATFIVLWPLLVLPPCV